MDAHKIQSDEPEMKLKHIFTRLFSKGNGKISPEDLREDFIEFFEDLKIPIANEQLQMILSIVRMRDFSAEQIKVPAGEMVEIPHDATLEEAVKIVVKSGHSRIPVYKEEGGKKTYIGILFAKDLLKLLMKKPKKFQLEKHLHRCKVVPESQSLLSLMRDMRLGRFHLVLTADEYGNISGLVTLEDILEEIVGDIRDEFDSTSKQIKQIGIRHYRVKGSIPITDLNDQLTLNLPEEKFNTLAGFLLHELKGDIQKNAKISYGNAEFTIDKFKKTEIQEVIVKIRKQDNNGQSG